MSQKNYCRTLSLFQMSTAPQSDKVQIYADFSDTTQKCEWCLQVFPSAQLTLVHDRRERRPPKSMCRACVNNSLQKATTAVTSLRANAQLVQEDSDLCDVSLQPTGQRFANYRQSEANAHVNAAHRNGKGLIYPLSKFNSFII